MKKPNVDQKSMTAEGFFHPYVQIRIRSGSIILAQERQHLAAALIMIIFLVLCKVITNPQTIPYANW